MNHTASVSFIYHCNKTFHYCPTEYPFYLPTYTAQNKWTSNLIIHE